MTSLSKRKDLEQIQIALVLANLGKNRTNPFDAALVAAAMFDQKTENPFQNPKNPDTQIEENPEEGF